MEIQSHLQSMSQAVVKQLYLCLLVILLSSCAVTPREHFIPKVEKPEIRKLLITDLARVEPPEKTCCCGVCAVI